MELVVFDLDGTLLNRNGRISSYTKNTLKLLASKGIAYTVATGRTLHSAQEIIDGHGFHLPHIYSNGAIIWDPSVESLSLKTSLTFTEVEHIIEATLSQGVCPFITAIDLQNNHYIFHYPVKNTDEERLLAGIRSRPHTLVYSIEDMPSNMRITNISILALCEKVDAIQSKIADEPHLVAYSSEAIEGGGLKWMDILHSEASKGGAIDLLRQNLGVSKIVCFGDSQNDVSMFEMADECYAPENASPLIKSLATEIIGHHDADGIAHYLRYRFNLPTDL